MERVLAIDPGTRKTGVVLMDEYGISCAATLRFPDACGDDIYSLVSRVAEIGDRLLPLLAAWNHDTVVVEAFQTFGPSRGRGNAYTWQTPHLVGYLQAFLEAEDAGKPVVWQTSPQVYRFGSGLYGLMRLPKGYAAKGMAPKARLAIMEKVEGGDKCRSDDTRSAACHGLYYLKTKEMGKEQLRLWND